MKYYVRTTNERDLTQYKILDYTPLVDTEHNPVKSFVEQLYVISDDDAVLLEDDLELCEDFQRKIEDVIKQYPDKIINFFYAPNDFFTTHETSMFCFNQCTYYPKGIAKLIADKIKEVQINLPCCRQYDTLELNALIRLKMTNIVYRPCLVQHKDINSIMRNGSGKWTIYYEDYLNKLGIDYKDAYQRQDELHKLLDEERQKW